MKLPAYKILHVFVFGFLLMLGTAFGAEEPPAPSPAQDTSLREGPEPNSPEGETGKLRRLDAAPLEDADAPADEAPDAPAPDAAPEPEDAQPERAEQHSRHSHHHGSERVAFWHDATLAEGEFADAVVSIFGSSTSAGEVGDAMVSIFGSSTSTGRVGDAVVSVMGSSRVSGGRVGDVVASIFGNTYVNTEVGDVVVAVLGNVELGPRAIVHGEVVCIGGTVKRHPDAVVHGQVNNVSFGANFGGFEWLHAWISRCLLLGRPLAFDARVMWAWWIALAFVGFYALLALLFPRGVQRCAETLETRPGYSILAAFLVALGTPLAALVLLPTVVGTPALIVTLFLIGLFGKAVFLAWIGRRLTRTSTRPEGVAPALAVLLGGAVLLLLYTVPVLGFIVAKLTSWLGLGVVFYTMMQSNKRPKLAPAAAVSPAAAAPVSTPLGATGGSAAAGFSPPPLSSAPAAAAPIPPVNVVAASTLPRAGFWIRLAASALDIIIVALVANLIPHQLRPNLLLMFAVYCALLWGLKGTTVGGIICGLKLVRLDERPLDWPTAIVRVLGGFLSLVAAGIGFIWVAFDDQKQSWHDKIAGTTIVLVPKGVSLV